LSAITKREEELSRCIEKSNQNQKGKEKEIKVNNNNNNNNK
jgi:hypothetical protein